MKFSINESTIINYTLTDISKTEYETYLAGLDTDCEELNTSLASLRLKISELDELGFQNLKEDCFRQKLVSYPLYEYPLIEQGG